MPYLSTSAKCERRAGRREGLGITRSTRQGHFQGQLSVWVFRVFYNGTLGGGGHFLKLLYFQQILWVTVCTVSQALPQTGPMGLRCGLWVPGHGLSFEGPQRGLGSRTNSSCCQMHKPLCREPAAPSGLSMRERLSKQRPSVGSTLSLEGSQSPVTVRGLLSMRSRARWACPKVLMARVPVALGIVGPHSPHSTQRGAERGVRKLHAQDLGPSLSEWG